MKSKTEAEYDINIANMVEEWGAVGKNTSIGFPTYINSTWLLHKDKFVQCWTNRVRHFDNTTSNRVESSYSTLKAGIATPTQAIDTLFMQVDIFVNGQLTEIKKTSLEASRWTHEIQGLFMCIFLIMKLLMNKKHG